MTKSNPLPKSVEVVAGDFYSKNQNLICNLYSRWMDEREYEDIADYAKVIKPTVEKIGAVFGKMSKRPFGFTFILEGITCRISVSGEKYTLGFLLPAPVKTKVEPSAPVKTKVEPSASPIPTLDEFLKKSGYKLKNKI